MLKFAVAGKAWVALLGSLLTFAVPFVVQLTAGLPEPWPAVIGAGVALATALGVYHAPYAPTRGSTPTTTAGGTGGTPWPTT